jgi:hypothetical protein
MSTTQPEVRQALPYVSHLKIVKRANLQAVTVKDQQGNDVPALMQNQPSIQVEITLYIVSVDTSTTPPTVLTEKAFTTPYTFNSKLFLQGILDDINRVSNPSPQLIENKKIVEDRLANENLWLEDVLEKANIPTLEGLWSDAFSESLDQFPVWKESNSDLIAGIKTYSRQIEWDARLSYEEAKSVTVTLGLYSTAKCEEMQPERKTLTFEDGATKRQREATIAQLDTVISDRTAAIAAIDAIKVAKALPAGQAKTNALAQYNQQLVNHPDLDALRAQTTQELAGYQTQKTQLASVTYGSIAQLVSLPSIASSMKPLVVDGIIATLKGVIPEWADLDMAVVGQRFALPSVE